MESLNKKDGIVAVHDYARRIHRHLVKLKSQHSKKIIGFYNHLLANGLAKEGISVNTVSVYHHDHL